MNILHAPLSAPQVHFEIKSLENKPLQVFKIFTCLTRKVGKNVKQFVMLHKLLQEVPLRLKEHNCYRTIPCLGLTDEDKVQPDLSCVLAWCCIAHLGQSALSRVQQLGLQIWCLLKWSERGNPPKCPDWCSAVIYAWKCFLDESADCSETQQRCEADLCVNKFLGMYVVKFLITESYEQNVALKAAVLAGFCGDSGVFASKLSSVTWQRDAYTIYSKIFLVCIKAWCVEPSVGKW